MSSNWICSCGTSNSNNMNTCQACGNNKPVDSKLKLIIIGSIVGVLLIILLVVVSLKLLEGPKKKYKAAVTKCCDSTDCCGNGAISCEEADKIATSLKMSEDDKQKLINEVKKDKCVKPSSPSATLPSPSQSSSPSAPNPSGDSVNETKKQEAARHIQEGFRWIALAKNSSNDKAAFEESMNNAINEYTKAIELESRGDKSKIGKAYEHRGTAYMVLKKMNKAEEDLKMAVDLIPTSYSVYYNLACLYSLENKIDFALDNLDKALENGFKEYDLLRKDSELKNLRKSPEFKTVLEKHKVFIK
ncbi:MAG: hypothetical protein HQL04_02155 [Nitrospirae bacterium]|nr:hypothetical protein [Nitrospirota bacterium]